MNFEKCFSTLDFLTSDILINSGRMKEEILVADLVEVVGIYLKTLLIVSFVFLRFKIIKNLFYFKRLTFILPEAQIREFSLVKKLKFWLFRFHVRR